MWRWRGIDYDWWAIVVDIPFIPYSCASLEKWLPRGSSSECSNQVLRGTFSEKVRPCKSGVFKTTKVHQMAPRVAVITATVKLPMDQTDYPKMFWIWYIKLHPNGTPTTQGLVCLICLGKKKKKTLKFYFLLELSSTFRIPEMKRLICLTLTSKIRAQTHLSPASQPRCTVFKSLSVHSANSQPSALCKKQILKISTGAEWRSSLQGLAPVSIEEWKYLKS